LSEDGLPDRGSTAAETGGDTELPLLNLLHEFNAHQNPSRVVEGLESQHRLSAEFNAPVVLLDQVV
jgi:hypothetical protein